MVFSHELRTTEKKSLNELKQAKTVEEATRVFEKTYERAGVKAMGSRLEWAKKALQALKGKEKGRQE